MNRSLPKVVLIGTDHRYQEGCADFPEVAHQAFDTFVRRCIHEHGVAAIAEEHSLDALAGKGLYGTVLESMAQEVSLAHRYCDPSIEQSRSMRILQANQIRLKGWPSSRPSEEEVASELAGYNRRREEWWLQELETFNAWPCLFICGSDHTYSFEALLRKSGWNVHVAAANWSA